MRPEDDRQHDEADDADDGQHPETHIDRVQAVAIMPAMRQYQRRDLQEQLAEEVEEGDDVQYVVINQLRKARRRSQHP